MEEAPLSVVVAAPFAPGDLAGPDRQGGTAAPGELAHFANLAGHAATTVADGVLSIEGLTSVYVVE